MKSTDSRSSIRSSSQILGAVTVLLALALLCCPEAFAAPMRCSGEQKLCIAGCMKNPDKSMTSTCVTNCGARQSLCMKTGCWDSGSQKYCGLTKQ